MELLSLCKTVKLWFNILAYRVWKNITYRVNILYIQYHTGVNILTKVQIRWLKKRRGYLKQKKIIFTAALFLSGMEASPFGNRLIWRLVRQKTSLNGRAGESAHCLFEVFQQKSRRCTMHSVIVTIHCNNRRNDNTFFPPVKQSQSLGNRRKDLSADNQNSRWGTQLGFFCCQMHMTFFSLFFLFFSCTKLCVPDRSRVETLPAATDCLLLL